MPAYTPSEIKAYMLLSSGNISTSGPSIRECADEIILLAEKIKSERASITLDVVSEQL